MRPWRLGALVCATAWGGAALFGVGAAYACTASDSGVVNVSQTNDKGEGEPSLSVNPQNPNELVAGSNQLQATFGSSLLPSSQGVLGAAQWSSHDGGCTWQGGQRLDPSVLDLKNPLPVQGLLPSEFQGIGNVITADQHSAWDRHGNVFYEDGGLFNLSNPGDQYLKVFHSANGGLSWDPGVIAYSTIYSPPPVGSFYAIGQEPLDRPWLAVDRSGGPRDGTVYATFETSPFSEGLPPEVYATASADHGQTWTRVRRVDTGFYATQFNPRQFPVVGADGALNVMYDVAPLSVTVGPGLQIGKIKIALARSTDGGQTFQQLTVDDNVHRIDSPDEALPFYTETIPAIAADPTHAGRLAVAWPERLSASNSRVVLRTTTDGGQTWSARIDVADDPAGVDNQHDHVTLAYTPDGRLLVEWRDRRSSGGTFADPFDVWVRELTPDAAGNMTLGSSVRLTTSPQQSTFLHRGGPVPPSEFIGLTATATTVMSDWEQVVGSLTDIVFRSLPRAALETPTVLPGARICTSRRAFVIRIRRPAGNARVTSAVVYVDGRRVAVRRTGGRLTSAVVLRGLPRRTVTVRIVVHTSDKHRYADSRTYHTCAPRPNAHKAAVAQL